MGQIEGQYQLKLLAALSNFLRMYSSLIELNKKQNIRKIKGDSFFGISHIYFEQNFDHVFENLKRLFGAQKQLWFIVC